MRFWRVSVAEPGVEVWAHVNRTVWWRFRMWLVASFGQWGIAIVRNDGGRRGGE